MTELKTGQVHIPEPNLRTDLSGGIEQALTDSGRITPEILDYIETSLFPAQTDLLSAFLNSDDNARDTLLSLMFSPDKTAQVRIESILAAAPCTADEEIALKNYFMAQPIRVPVFLPESGSPGHRIAEVELPDEVVSNYIGQLRLSRTIPDRLARAITAALSDAMILMVRVRIRNSGLSLTPFQETVLCRFFERIPESDPEFEACLDAMIAIVGLPDKASVSLYDRLMREKRTLFIQLRQSQRMERLLRHATMETLMTQGIRGGSIGKEDLLARMRRIDRLCVALTDRTLPMDLPMEIPVREISDISAMTWD